MTGGPVAQKNDVGDAPLLLRKGSIYERLDKARAKRRLVLSPPMAANDQRQANSTLHRNSTPSKRHLLPEIKPQEAFDPPVKNSRAASILKLGIRLVAFSAMAGFTLTDWRTNAPQIAIVAPVGPSLEVAKTNISKPDIPTRVADVAVVSETPKPSLPVIPASPAESAAIQLQQETDPLTQPIVEQSSRTSMADLILKAAPENSILPP